MGNGNAKSPRVSFRCIFSLQHVLGLKKSRALKGMPTTLHGGNHFLPKNVDCFGGAEFIVEPGQNIGEWDRGDPKYSLMVQQVLGKITTRSGSESEMGTVSALT